ncbi:hypothetical protein BH10PSE9_BH10PSE9_13600 [soil metagenome]
MSVADPHAAETAEQLQIIRARASIGDVDGAIAANRAFCARIRGTPTP